MKNISDFTSSEEKKKKVHMHKVRKMKGLKKGSVRDKTKEEDEVKRFSGIERGGKEKRGSVEWDRRKEEG